MSEIRVVGRYAKALLDLSKEQNNVEQVHSNMIQFTKVLNENHMLRAILKNPIVTYDKKIAVLNAIFSTNFEPITIKFFELMLRKSRGQFLPATALAFVDQYNELNNIAKATVRTAVQLTDEAAKMVEQMVAKSLNKTIHLDQQLDPSLIGGVWLKMGDRLYDGSIKGKLQKAKKELLNTYISK
jgi:F-type H+-transporting ATPase subunit delta